MAAPHCPPIPVYYYPVSQAGRTSSRSGRDQHSFCIRLCSATRADGLLGQLGREAALLMEVMVADHQPLDVGELPAADLLIRGADEVTQRGGGDDDLDADVGGALADPGLRVV